MVVAGRRSVRLSITGRVQGVGYRAFVERRARDLGLVGFVRNRLDGSVEAVIAGTTAAVEALVAACRRGPPGAAVTTVLVSEVSEPDEPAFRVLPTS